MITLDRLQLFIYNIHQWQKINKPQTNQKNK